MHRWGGSNREKNKRTHVVEQSKSGAQRLIGLPAVERSKRKGADARPPRRERPVDPDSPFAKLAALKAQLETGDGGKR